MREVRRISRVCEDAVYGSLPGPLPVLRACFAHFDRRRGCLVAGECERSGGRGGLASDESITACCLPKTNWICWRSSRSERIPLETPSVAECLDLRLSVTSPIQQDQQRAEIFALLALEELGSGADEGVAAIGLTVFFSVLAHGFSPSPLATRYGKAAAARGPEPRGQNLITARRSPSPAGGDDHRRALRQAGALRNGR